MTSERDNQNGPAGQQQQYGEQAQQQQSPEMAGGQADYGSPRGEGEDGGADQGGGGMSKEEWLRQNPDGAFDPEPAPGEGMSKEDWLRQNGDDQGSGKESGGRY